MRSVVFTRIDNGLVDIGGTYIDATTTFQNLSIAVDFSGIRTNFRMADVLSIPLGGGTMINNLVLVSELSVEMRSPINLYYLEEASQL